MSSTIIESLISSGDAFDVQQHASKILQSSIADVSRHVQELTEAEHDLERQLEDHVSTHHQDLLSQATGVERLEGHLVQTLDQQNLNQNSRLIYESFSKLKGYF